jgi:hypothetical protein
MRLTTITIPAVEMTLEEENLAWIDSPNWEKKGILDWNTSDGHNEILFKGESNYRQVVRKGNA